MKVGEKKTFSVAVDGCEKEKLSWNTEQKDVAVTGWNYGSTRAVVTARTAGTDVLFVKYGKDKVLRRTITVTEKKPELPKESKETAYIVEKGDTLWKISRKFKTTVKVIADRNKLKNPDVIHTGQKLMIPEGK